jgi:hypothetical protein
MDVLTQEENVRILPIINCEKNNNTNDITGIIICITEGDTYDNAYRKVNQKETDNIVSYIIKFDQVENFYNELIKDTESENINYNEIKKNIKLINSNNIMIYFECCSCLEQIDFKFPNKCIELIEYFIFNIKCLILCADFSLKCLINDWDENKFGKNPFVVPYDVISTGKLEIDFDKHKFLNSNLRQLKVIAQLVDENKIIGNIMLNVMESTISYKINNLSSDKYDIDILSMVKDYVSCEDCFNSNKRQKLSNTENEDKFNYDFDKNVGQAIIKFKEGGKILISNGHFSELCKINYTEESLRKLILNEWGGEYYEKYIHDINSSDNQEYRNSMSDSYISALTSDTLSY